MPVDSCLRSSVILILSSLLLLGGCRRGDQDLEQALATISSEHLAEDIAVLASDDFEGRAPSSRGEELTINYLKDQFQAIGLVPGNGDSFFQEVPLVAITASVDRQLSIGGESEASPPAFGNDYVAWTKRVVGRTEVRSSEMVFVGYGIVAPEQGWDDYEDVDVKGKTVVILVNDPGFATQDDSLFNGNAMTYYGRWTYKFEEAARQGAEAAFIIHEEKAAGYPWAVVQSSWSGKQFDLVNADNNMSRCAIEGWFQQDVARTLFENAGLEFDEIVSEASTRDFAAKPLGQSISLALINNIEHSKSNNVIAVLPGTQRADEYIFYMAHWDHFGLDESLQGDKIYNGAFDNASGTAGLLELAEAFAALENRPPRSIVFLAVAAEEQGLLGSKHYATNPVFPRNQTVAAINIDGLNIYGRMRDIIIVGYGNSELDDYVKAAAAKQKRVVRPDPEPNKGYFYRSDHFSFAKKGVPALYTDNGIDHIEHGEEWTRARMDEYTKERYHKPSDEFDPDWDLSGGVDDLRLLFRVGYALSMEATFPNWRPGNEFRARRDAEMQSTEVSSSR